MTPRDQFPSRPWSRSLLAATASAVALLLAGPWASGQQPPPAVDPGINKQFADPDVKEFVRRFETESREVYARREAIVAALGLKKGMTVADVGAGTGVFTRLIAERVGTVGKVYAVDISEPFLKHIAAESKRLGQTQVRTIHGSQTSTYLSAGSIDLVFVCDVYHHVEKPGPWLSSIHKGLRTGGHFVVVEFDKQKAQSSDFVKKHVRAEKSVFLQEIRDAGFETVPTPEAPVLKENFFQTFLKLERPAGPDGE